jgi:RecB family exonuclease
LLGRIDLLVIDKNGYPQVIDYKTSPKLYKDYASAKQLGFTYQLGTYERMLRRWGINTANTDVMVAPIQMKGFRKEGDEWVFDSVERAFEKLHRGGGEEADQPALASLSDRLTKDWLNNNMNEYMEAPLVVEASA